MGKKSEYKVEAKEISNGDTNVDIELPAVPNGYKRTLQHISCENESDSFDGLKIGYVTQFGRYHWWVEEESLAAALLYWMQEPKVLAAGMKLVIRFIGTDATEILAAYVDGFTEKVE